ncbi:porin [Corticibacterium sp. UT-5YL-CI-8]|nr:porin [Tianweitania sp. UT-5YL-CI-8]
MNIKSLLLGSAAALLAVSGARAADAIVVAEPEPMEYVRICDVYGAGFYYIPGTETCLSIGGLVRYQINWDDGDDGFRKDALMRLKIDARSETEYGTFRRYIEFQASARGSRGFEGPNGVWYDDENDSYTGFGAPIENGTALRHAYFELGGLLVGHTDTLFDGDLSGEFDLGGGERVNQIRYTFDAGNGISVSMGLEEERENYDYVPLVVGKVSIAQGWGSVDLFAGYDNFYEEFAVKGIAKIKATEAVTLELLAAYESGPTYWSLGAPYIGYEWSAGGYLKFQVNEKLAIGAGGQYLADRHFGSGNDSGYFSDGLNDWVVGAVVDYKIVENLDAKLALNYYDGDSYDVENGGDGDGHFNGFLRLDASF